MDTLHINRENILTTAAHDYQDITLALTQTPHTHKFRKEPIYQGVYNRIYALRKGCFYRLGVLGGYLDTRPKLAGLIMKDWKDKPIMVSNDDNYDVSISYDTCSVSLMCLGRLFTKS